MTQDTAEKSSQTPYDAGYKNLFSHAIMVEDLLRGFIKDDWINDLDFTTLEKVPGNYVSEDFRKREEDVVWRIRWKGKKKWLFIYLLLEFQSQVDEFMALRIMVYLGLLYEDLRKSGKLQDGKLPPVFPIVLYNGKPIWDAPTNIRKLIGQCPSSLRKYLPSLPYYLMSEQHYSDEELDLTLRNFSKALFRLEKARKPPELLYVMKRLMGWLEAPKYDSLRRVFTMFIKRITFVKRRKYANLIESDDLEEIYNMLAGKLDEWMDEREAKGREEGREEGITEGWQKGRQQGRTEGKQEGKAEGLKIALLKQLEFKFDKVPPETIGYIEHLSAEQVILCIERVLSAKNLAQVFDLAQD